MLYPVKFVFRKERATIAECRMLNVALKDALKCLQKRDNRMIPSILSILKRAEESKCLNFHFDDFFSRLCKF